jgi:hypothetical protein
MTFRALYIMISCSPLIISFTNFSSSLWLEEKSRLEAVQRDWRLSRPTRVSNCGSFFNFVILDKSSAGYKSTINR